ncbi:TetR/AcrR family transcriptional regulator [Paraglaciecola polaris]|uniref:Transcriptional regulator, TetR family n=1 Tax=Paraglaciecola polaris LMG 21857 TaxID=1129793 RepID=K6ZS26_9ALTE|nr:TetR/AcrR family transcriptional regulator [Paraglaciecola polaris]GAC31638.1 transcriptional regulator, TetR family [Paraglaciecola polaris LMG 21857]
MNERKQGRRSAEDAEKTKQDILQKAAELFCDLGYEQVSLRNISEKAGVSHSLIRHHFGSKENIWHCISDGLHHFIARYVVVVNQHMPETYPSNIRLFEFSVRMLAYMLTFKQPVQLLADAVRQDDALVDYFISQGDGIEDFVEGLVKAHNSDFPDAQIRMWDLKWQIIMYAHAAASLTPFLKETWIDETDSLDECLLRHFRLFEEMLAAKLKIAQPYRVSPKRVQDLVYEVPAPDPAAQ